MGFISPYFFVNTTYEEYISSLLEDIDEEGRSLFKKLNIRCIYEENKLLGFIQYGYTSYVFDEKGSKNRDKSYFVIRNLYFIKDRNDVGEALLKEALKEVSNNSTIYAYFHYFGMSCFARHGKLYQSHKHIEELLLNNGFEIEHENIYYSSSLDSDTRSDIKLVLSNIKDNKYQQISFFDIDKQVGGCEIHFVNKEVVYLRWIYISSELINKGYGSKAMTSLKVYLYSLGYKRLDTDTANTNISARGYYNKNSFSNMGKSRSYIMKCGNLK